jgi:hypothetical protein
MSKKEFIIRFSEEDIERAYKETNLIAYDLFRTSTAAYFSAETKDGKIYKGKSVKPSEYMPKLTQEQIDDYLKPSPKEE